MMITDEHMEWATVDRMRDMLVNVHDDYKVTHPGHHGRTPSLKG